MIDVHLIVKAGQDICLTINVSKNELVSCNSLLAAMLPTMYFHVYHNLTMTKLKFLVFAFSSCRLTLDCVGPRPCDKLARSDQWTDRHSFF